VGKKGRKKELVHFLSFFSTLKRINKSHIHQDGYYQKSKDSGTPVIPAMQEA
jgi:hypothetical protein